MATRNMQVAPRSYIVDVGGRELRRNRKFLRTTQEQTEPEVLESAGPDLSNAPFEETVRVEPATYGNPGPEVPENPETLHLGPERRTRTRVVKGPSRFKDYV